MSECNHYKKWVYIGQGLGPTDCFKCSECGELATNDEPALYDRIAELEEELEIQKGLAEMDALE